MDTAFDQLYNAYYMQVYSYVMTLAKNQHTAEEITQKTFFKILVGGKTPKPGAPEFPWLCTIAKNLFLDEQRRQKPVHALEHDPADDTSVENDLISAETSFRLHQVLHNLEEPYKEVFQLRIFGELSFRQIGQLFQKTENWARVTHHRARLMIQERMDG